MKVYRFNEEVGRALTAFGSHDVVLSRILTTTLGVQIGCFHVASKGTIALHQAAGPQLFMVVHGDGWVRGNGGPITNIHAGQAVFWEDGEWHETGTEDGLIAIVVEGTELEPDLFMPLAELPS